jgi:hypothetical protein
MERFTNAELADMHLMYGAAGGNGLRAARLYRERFPAREVPGHRFFISLHRRLRDTGSFQVNRMHLGRPGQRAVENEERVIEHFENHPRTSTRAAAQHLGVAHHANVWRILHNHRLHPFHFQRVQGLLPRDFGPRVQFSEWFLQKQAVEGNFSERVLFTDEAHFTRDGVFNTHNSHNWAANNPHVTHRHSHQYRFSVNVWAGIVSNNLIGPYLMPSPLTGPVYRTFLEDVLPGLLEDVPLDIRRIMWYQHDGAPAHFHANTRLLLDEVFPNRWIGRNGPVAWPARSPDMTPLDFFLWGAMKALVYETPVDSEQDLVARIAVAAGDIAEIPHVFESVRHSLYKRYEKCVEVHGDHFEQLL